MGDTVSSIFSYQIANIISYLHIMFSTKYGALILFYYFYMQIM